MTKPSKYISIIPHNKVSTRDPLRSISNSKVDKQAQNRQRVNKSIIILPDSPNSSILNPRRLVKLSPIPNESKYFTPSRITNSSFLKVHRSSVFNEISSMLAQKIEKSVVGEIDIKKAYKNREWMIKAKEIIGSEFSRCINESNGIVMNSEESCYKFYLGKGNNSALVKQVLASRWWWVCVDENELPNVNLVWTQSTNIDYLKTISVTYYKPTNPIQFSQKSIKCLIPLETESQEKFSVNISSLNFDLITQSASYTTFKDLKRHSSTFFRTHNKLEMNQILTDKKFLCKIMKKYYESLGKDPGSNIPLTFHIESIPSSSFEDFVNYHQCSVLKDENILWIVKPGENSNRGNGIFVTNDIHQITETIKSEPSHSFIIQKYIDRPFLISKRKFDIRLFTLVTSVNSIIQCYFYKEGYLRTSSKEFTTKNLSNNLIHLTNDAIQKHAEDYGKYENGNKLSYSDFQRYLDLHNKQVNFIEDILPQIKNVVKDTIKASFLKIDEKKRTHSFEILGYDFLLDSELRPWLIEVNTNPCLELSSSILVRIIPAMLENALRIALDPVFPEPLHVPKRVLGGFVQEMVPENKFELIFHEQIDGRLFLKELEENLMLEKFLQG